MITIENKKKLCAPYVDIMDWPTFDIIATAKATGHYYYTLAFIVSGANNMPLWGGLTPIGDWFSSQVKTLRSLGGDVIISLGGAAGSELAQTITNINLLAYTYQRIVYAYSIKYIDFDIEGTAIGDPIAVDRRNKAIKILQTRCTFLKISYTLPVLPTGLDNNGLYVLENAISNNTRIDRVNLMVMNYGTYFKNGVAENAIDAAKSTYNQLKTIKMDAKIGLTPMLGVNDVKTEIFKQEDAQKLLDFANKNEWIDMVSFWSMNRDVECKDASPNPPYNSSGIVQKKYDFINIFKTYQDTIDNPPGPVCSNCCDVHCPKPTPIPTKPTPVPTKPTPIPTKPTPIPTKPTPIPTKPTPVPIPDRPSDTILKLVSIAENSSTEWKKQINYIENIKDGRGFTVSIVGFCTGTWDFIQVLQEIKKIDSKHPLVKFIPLVQKVDGTGSTNGLEQLPSAMKTLGINDPTFNQAMWTIINKLYWGPAKEYCKAKNLKSQLAYYIAYDTILNLGSLGQFNNLSGSDEVSKLSDFLNKKQRAIENDPTLGESKNNRVDMQKSLLKLRNMELKSPMNVMCYGDSFVL